MFQRARRPEGCATTGAAAASPPTFSKDVAPILFKNCTHCHRPGEVAPMSLLTYKDARPWAKAIHAAVLTGVMPPWHADPAHGEFANDRRLSEADKNTIAAWVAARERPKAIPPTRRHCRVTSTAGRSASPTSSSR